ncbi:MAG: error-prone DNA polymerase [Chloroflexi bacterium]|nr:error-prone DNA polymerase [Chloroflexota bacterium]
MTNPSCYVELHAHSYFSLLDGASSPDELVNRAQTLGMSLLALTDHDAVYGAPRFVQAAHKAGIRPILGAELTLDDYSHLTLLVKDEQGWQNLCALITAARHNAPKGEAVLSVGALEGHTGGLIALSGCRQGRIARALLKRDKAAALSAANDLLRLFGTTNFWVELQHHRLPDDNRLVAHLAALATHIGMGVAATNNVHYAAPDGHLLQDVLVCIRDNTTLDESNKLRPNSEYYLKSGNEIEALFAAYPQAVTNTLRIAEQCTFELQYGLQELPRFPTPCSLTADTYLHQLCIKRAMQLGFAIHTYEQIDYELRVIHNSGLSNYFLIVWDIVRYAREQGILCQGRGSAANSLVAYLLDISPINPLSHDLVFERFLSSERQVVPDIDIDFDAARREEVIQYVYQRYGLEHAAMASTFVTFRARSAIRDVGRSLGLPLDVLEHVTTSLDVHQSRNLHDSTSLKDALGGQIEMQTWQQIVQLAEQLDGFPRHLGIHNGGMVITEMPLAHRVPTEPATMTDRHVTQWDKEALEDIGMVKIDILGLRMLSAIAEAVSLISENSERVPDLSQLTFDDPAVYNMICTADTVGVFQVESRAQAQVLPRLNPRSFADLIICISLIRPGPVQGDMVHPYLRRRDGEEAINYLHPLLEDALKETLGVILFQEQCLKVAQSIAGFTAGQGELLRRALGAKNTGAAIDKFYNDFIAGAAAKGVETDVAETIFNRLRAFGGYSFPKSHAASFAVLVYHSAWLKCYHPAAFYTALLNNQPMGFWSPAILINDAQRHSIPIYPVDVNRSQYGCILEDKGIRLGFNYINGFGEETGKKLVEARGGAPFEHLKDFRQRVMLSRNLMENLIAAGAMDIWQQPRRNLIWQLATFQNDVKMLNLISASEAIALPVLSQAEKASMEYGITGLSTGSHPIVFYRLQLNQHGILSSLQFNQHPTGNKVCVAGLIVVHQAPPTAKGYRFITLEDEHGFINLIVKPKIYVEFRRIIRSASLLLAEGQVQRQGTVTNLIVERCMPFKGL